jgi:hypothetical protein
MEVVDTCYHHWTITVCIIMNKEEALASVNLIEEYFSRFDNIEDYIRNQKLSKMDSIPASLPGMGIETDLFNSFDMSPEDMKFQILPIKTSVWDSYIDIISSHSNMKKIPGKTLKLAIKETTTNKYVGFIRLGSPVVNCKPRNALLGEVPGLEEFNHRVIMGFVIVPAQPFGYNYLGGKLLAGIACSHEVREMINKKYGSDIVMFETTSLYGNSKSASQYDGMKPFLRFKGLTDSDFMPTIVGESFDKLCEVAKHEMDWDISKVSSPKMKGMNQIVAKIKRTLEGDDLKRFLKIETHAKTLIEQKRYYVCNYGIENYVDIVNGLTDNKIKASNYDRYHLENIIDWWKNKATKRYNTLKQNDQIRNDIEVWSGDKNIDIIR